MHYDRTTSNKKIAERLCAPAGSGAAGNAFRQGLSSVHECVETVHANDFGRGARMSDKPRQLQLMTFSDDWVADQASEQAAIVQNGHARIAVAQFGNKRARRKALRAGLWQRNGKHHSQIVRNREVDPQR
jgi:hypothetical protein